jgi:perosamine synthetase
MIPLFKVFTPEGALGEDIQKILQSGQLTSGVYVRQFEKQLQEYLGNPYVMVTGSNTYASLIALALCGIKNDDEVIASPMACLASNQPVLNFGARLVWADIDPHTGSLDPEDVRKKITSRTKVILHYHWGGYPGYINEINAIGKEFGIPVIDDAIESFGAQYNGNRIGNTGTDITTFSFQTVRLPNSIDGGGIAFKTEALYKRALQMRDFGINRSTFRDALGEINPQSDINMLGYNAIMNEVNACIGNAVMAHTPKLIEQQRANAAQWDAYCDERGYQRLNLRKEIVPNYWIYSFLTNQQEEVMQQIRGEGYYASKVHIRNDYYSCFGTFNQNLRGVNEFAAKQLSVPSGWWLQLS